MRLVKLFLLAAFAASTVDAASYQRTDGTIVDPIMDQNLDPHPYSGNNLEPNADLSYAILYNAYLWRANLSNANLTGANLRNANLSGSGLINVGYWSTTSWTDAYYYTDNELSCTLAWIKHGRIRRASWRLIQRAATSTATAFLMQPSTLCGKTTGETRSTTEPGKITLASLQPVVQGQTMSQNTPRSS